jgi:hypothetical protein
MMMMNNMIMMYDMMMYDTTINLPLRAASSAAVSDAAARAAVVFPTVNTAVGARLLVSPDAA